VHLQQTKTRDASLLNRSIREGAVDFVGARLSGINVNRAMYALAEPREAERWEESRAVMHDEDVSYWLYGGADGERPADLGCFIGHQICAAYFAQAEGEASALDALLRQCDAVAFLEASGYDPR